MVREVKRPAAEVFHVVEDIERFPEFLPNVTAITIVEQSRTRKVANWDTLIDNTPLSWLEEGIYDHDHFVVHFRALEGVLERFDGVWRVDVCSDGRSRISFELMYEIGLPEIEDLIGPMLRERLAANAES